MVAEADLKEYLEEIREHVCSRCPERPPGGPPCVARGKDCGVEMHLPELIDSIHAVNSKRLAPYLAHNRMEICSRCALLHSDICPCPMDYLALLVVEAVENVDETRAQRAQEKELLTSLTAPGRGTLEDIERAYEEGAGRWTGCDWPTHFGPSGLDLNGWRADQAETVALEAAGTAVAAAWEAAAQWLAQVEQYARRAETHALAALEAARLGHWDEARQQADRAWALEFATGRPFRKGAGAAWKTLRLAVESAWLASLAAVSATERDTAPAEASR
jgi:hypothetical protein